MKKWLLLILAILLLNGCAKISTVSISKLDEVSKSVKKYIQPKLKLQLIKKNQDHCYIFYRSVNDVQFSSGIDGNAVQLSLYEEPSNSNEVKTFMYKLTKQNTAEYVRVFIDDEYVKFEAITNMK